MSRVPAALLTFLSFISPTATFAESIEVLAVRTFVPDSALKSFEAAYPDIKVKKLPDAQDYDDLTERLLRNDVTGDLPDVIFQGYNRAKMTYSRGLVALLDPYLSGDAEWARESYVPTSDALCHFNDQSYGLPYVISVPVVYYNLDLMEEAGLDTEHLPTTWEGITGAAAMISARHGGAVGAIFDYLASGNWTYTALINSQGGRMLSDDDAKIAFNGAEGLRGLNVLKMFGEAGQIDMDRSQAFQAFSSGSVGLLVSSSGFLTNLTKQANFDFRVAPFPLEADGKLPAGGSCIMMTSKDPEKQKAAWTFMKFMSEVEMQRVMFDTTGYVPGNKIAVEKIVAETDPADNRLVAVEAARSAIDWFSFPGANSLRITDVIKAHLRDVITLKASPKDAMNRMSEEVQELLD
ncbi:extracellular solute-binding protein [Mesorhizobium sp. M5C.F.Ca.IN.020.32.2.1]|uniref:extracellular solute-binding protein n=1 Tax=Mesorhizobium sp. M5C.F.Ca.IN.020.32.2.1 TaxID=2496771 RepID=UPI0013E37D24|nr:extracellular solute-binding protein [Mesorhizobium sp. M5C.F.Ca.IN.020.32.2.1]